MQIKFNSTALRNCNHSGALRCLTRPWEVRPFVRLSVPLSVCFVLMKLILIPLIIMMSDVDDDYVIVVAVLVMMLPLLVFHCYCCCCNPAFCTHRELF